jgi:hypothetical protein
MSILDGMTQISPTVEASPAAGSGRFPTLTVADDPSTSDFVVWLRQLIQAIDVWGEPEPEDAVQYGQFVRCAGLIANYLGFADLFEESLTVAEVVPRHVFGAVLPACSQDEAYLFFGTCISRALEAAAPAVAKTNTEHMPEPTAAPSAKRLGKRYRAALEVARLANIQGKKTDEDIYAWARTRRGDLPCKLPPTLETFSRYLRQARRLVELAGETAQAAIMR